MTFKRSFDDGISDEVPNGASFKHQRLVGNSDHVSSFYLGQVGSWDDVGEQCDLGDSKNRESEFGSAERPENGSFAGFWEVAEVDTADILPRSLSLSPWAKQTAGDVEGTTDVAMHLPFLPESFSFDCPARAFRHVEDTYHHLDSPPRKRVPIGPDHQADIPDLPPWRKADDCQDGESNHLSGNCVIPFSEFEICGDIRDEVGHGRSGCSCRDQGSFRCVRQHVDEARQKLRNSLGPRVFSELGFLDIGEVVAERWTVDDEHLFHEVVFSNPASFGKNFWDVLPYVFPSRTRMEIVSYYFNVFMLRKRAEQNRVDPMNVDSDDDEWQGGVKDHADGEGDISEEDEDSEIESPSSSYSPLHYERHLAENNVVLDRVYDDEDGDPEVLSWEYLTSGVDSVGMTAYDEYGENQNHDGCYTSPDSETPQESQLNPDSCEQWRDFVLEPCDAKLWDAYLSCSDNNVDLLPTCNMIEEVFGDEGP